MTAQTDYTDATRAKGEAIIELDGVDKFFGEFQALKGIDKKEQKTLTKLLARVEANLSNGVLVELDDDLDTDD